MKFVQFILTIIIAVAVSYGVLHLQKSESTAVSEVKKTAYDRVMETGTLRCGYYMWPPLVAKDPNTGALQGLSYDFTLEVAKITELKIDWVGEMVASTYLRDLQDGRYDAECAEGWPNGVRGKYAYYSKPYAFIPVVAVVRADDARFTSSNREALNDPAITMATLDGETSQIIMRLKFPNAKELSLPQTTPMADQIMNVVAGKADAVLTDTLTADGFIKANPGKVKMIAYDPPLHVAALGFTLPQDDRLKNLLDVATDQLLANGTVEKLVRPYAKDGLVLLPSDIAKPLK